MQTLTSSKAFRSGVCPASESEIDACGHIYLVGRFLHLFSKREKLKGSMRDDTKRVDLRERVPY